MSIVKPLKLPYGISDFYSLRQENYLYIDLTQAIPQLKYYRQALEKKYQQPERLHCLAVVAIGFERLVWEKV
jgi:DNA integrity scanning protein DisA with diadenylate cyclase activity